MSIEKRIITNFKLASTFDTSAMKIASFEPDVYVPPDLEEFALTIRPDDRYCYMHVIAMTDAIYGSNLNGDVFRADELCGYQEEDEVAKNIGKLRGLSVPRYKTFETAKFFHHHANSDEDPFFGDVPFAAWNDPMRRVELIIRIYRRLDPMSASTIDQGGVVPVSMGCRIHHEKCLYCGNENELTQDRCVHLARMMNEIMPDGRLVAADNLKPRFIDISKVTIPADSNALSLGKVAEYGQPEVTFVSMYVSGKNAAYDVVDEAPRWRQKWSEIDKEIGTVGSGGTINGLSADDYEVGSCDQEPEMFSASEFDSMLDQCGGDINCLVATLTACGVVLSPTELCQLTMTATEKADPQATEKDAELIVPVSVSLDNFSLPLYHAHLTKISSRSGYHSAPAGFAWEPQKFAEAGGPEEIADLYSYYRKLIGSFKVSDFQKSANLNPALRAMIADEGIADPTRVKAAMYHLAFAGIVTE